MAKKIYDFDLYLGPEHKHDKDDPREYRGETWDCEIPQKRHMAQEDIDRNFHISCGHEGFEPKDWVPWKLKINGDASRWDHYNCEMSTGVFSPRAIEVLSPYFLREFPLLPVTVNDQPFFIVVFNEQLDCLDIENSKIRRLPPPKEHLIVRIKKFAFHKEKIPDPLIFSIPERRTFLFATESIPKIVADAGLRGFDFPLLDG